MNSWQTWHTGKDGWLVNDVDRDRVVALLRDAYVDGRLSPDDFDDRVTRALGAVTRADLNAALTGLAVVGGQAHGSRIAAGETLAAGVIGLSPLFLGPLGPIIWGPFELVWGPFIYLGPMWAPFGTHFGPILFRALLALFANMCALLKCVRRV